MQEKVGYISGVCRTAAAKRELNELCRDLVTQEIEKGRLKRPLSIRRLRRWVAKQVMHRVGLHGENLRLRWRQAALAAMLMSGMLLYTGTGAKAAITFEDQSAVDWDQAARTGNPLKVVNTDYQALFPAFADIDKDGDLDAFIGTVEDIGGYANGVIKYYRNDSGLFSEPTGTWNSSTKAGNPFHGINIGLSSPPVPAFADIDGDGDLDAFVGYSYGKIEYFVNTDGGGLFSRQTGTWDPVTKAGNPLNETIIDVSALSAPAFADIDGDGDLDAFLGYYYGNIKYYVNDGTGLFSVQTGTWDPGTKAGNPLESVVDLYPTAPAFADIDGDGDLDAFFVGYDGYDMVIKYYVNDGTGLFSEQFGTWDPVAKTGNPLASVSVYGFYSAPAFADLDRDGDLDVFFMDTNWQVGFFKNMNHPGDITGNDAVNSEDALKALRIAAGIDLATAADLAAGDVAPLVNGIAHPDGKIDLGDVVVILRLAVGL